MGKRFAGAVILAFLSTTSIAACGEQPLPPKPSAAPPTAPPISTLQPQPGTSTIPPNFTELPLDQTTQPAETVPWHLIRVDREKNRVHLSASSVDCTIPEKVRLVESVSEIRISVTGTHTGEPCTAQHATLVGYVQIGSVGDRKVTGNSS